MSRVVPLLVLLFVVQAAPAADLPPGALVRLGDDRFRAGSEIEHLAISPDGKQVATATELSDGVLTLAVWDATTGHPTREYRVNRELFKGFVWSASGAFAVITRAELGAKNEHAKVFLDDFRVWDFTDPKAAPPLLPRDPHNHGSPTWWVDVAALGAPRPRSGGRYTDFRLSADGRRVAARWDSGGKYAVHVFELKPTDTAAKLRRVGTIDLGAEGADEVRVSADGKMVITFRELANASEMTATTWEVATGKPAKPVRVPYGHRRMVTPDARALVIGFDDGLETGFDQYDLATGEKRELTRWKYAPEESGGSVDRGGFAFATGRHELVVAVFARKTSIIDLKTGKERGRVEGHSIPPSAVAVSADGTRIATADKQGLVRLWDAKTLRPLHDALGHRVPVEHAELSPDGKRLLTWAPDETVRLWDVATGKELRSFAGATGVWRERDAPTFAPDGTAVFYSTADRLIARDLQTGLEVPLPGAMKTLPPRFAVFSPDGKCVLTWVIASENYKDMTCEVWDWPSGKKRCSWKPSPSRELFWPGFSPDGSVIFDHPTLPHRRDAKTGEELPPAWKDSRTGMDTLNALRPNPCWFQDSYVDSLPRIAEAGTDKTLTRFRFSCTEGHPENVIGISAISPVGGQYAVWWHKQPDGICLCESATCRVRRVLSGHRGEVRVLGFTPDGTKLLTAGGDHTILVWDMRLQNVPLPEAIKNETSAAKLWNTLATGNAKDAYLAMARLAREPETALKLVKMKLKPATKGGGETYESNLIDARAIELLESLQTDDTRALLKELAGGHKDAFRTQEAKRALERN